MRGGSLTKKSFVKVSIDISQFSLEKAQSDTKPN